MAIKIRLCLEKSLVMLSSLSLSLSLSLSPLLSSLDQTGLNKFFLLVKVEALESEIDFHRKVYDLQKSYTQSLFKAVR